jgi:hypothetical protein
MSTERIRAVVRKELRDLRRNRFLVGTMAVLPLIFLVSPLITMLQIPADSPPPSSTMRSEALRCSSSSSRR